ncbi:alpha/beta hydrolase [Paenibacillus sp. MER TA 81-3]|uniref:alpha/beta fold hydrolase n=1 Tax=Paenibacillus sp. MER TA 81-3 TaxID=2939573 RepID=UPI00203DDF2F|nr:alpha/beta hydrolase [Paenibacillus sp. MER TA 81-3]MCM3342745.1 alpha/beta hydrolase [Paenibacillus sp. MER TA 81-3]
MTGICGTTQEAANRICFEAIGEGQPLLVLHGFTLDHRTMMRTLEPVLAGSSGWLRIYADLPGMGRPHSGGPVTASDDMLKVLAAFVKRVIPHGSFAICGHSYGAYLARGLARLMPQRISALVLLAPVVHPTVRTVPLLQAKVRDDAFLARLTPAEREVAARKLVVQTEPVWQRYTEEVLPAQALADWDVLTPLRSGGYALSCPPDEHDEPPAYPMRIIVGKQDSIVGWHDAVMLTDTVPNSAVTILNGAGHFLHLEQEEQVQRWLADSFSIF